jgi:hypothetical protein
VLVEINRTIQTDPHASPLSFSTFKTTYILTSREECENILSSLFSRNYCIIH